MNCYGVGTGVRMNKQIIIVVDADAIIAQTNPEDVFHQSANAISQVLINLNARILYPITAIVEANAHIQRVLNDSASAYETAVFMGSPVPEVVETNKQTLLNALDYFSSSTSKKNTLLDCIVAAIAKEYKADAIFSYDKFYKRNGFKLASEL